MKTRKNLFARTLKIFSLFAITLIMGLCTFTVIAPETMTDILGALGLTLSAPLALMGLPLMGSIHFEPAGGGGGGGGTKTAEELLMDNIRKEVKAVLDNEPTLKAAKELSEKLTALNTLVEKGAKPEEITTLKAELDKALLDIKALKDASIVVGKDRAAKAGPIAAAMVENKSKIDKFISEKSGKIELEIKATETSTDITNRDDIFSWHEGMRIGEIPYRRPFMRELFPTVNTETEFIKYLDQATVVRDAKNVALCAATTHNTKLTWITRTIQVEKVRDFVHVCLDMMNDYTFVQGEISKLLTTSLQLKIDDGLLLGNGISPNLHSVDEIASTFAADGGNPGGEEDYTAEVVSANLMDLIVVAGAQIRTFGSNNKWTPNYVLLNPRNLNELKFLKDTQNNYLNRNQMFTNLWQDRAGNYYVDGMLLVENSLVPVNEFYIGDFRFGTIYSRKGYSVEFSYENRENFETETVTVKVYERLNLLIRTVDNNAFMHVADIDQAIFDISVPT